ncbi:MAG TPA: LPS export ABC transporter ATP-binding protein [Gemmatimonadaceae bacterium]|nr:LPS export ABC transporter ATP-binding protein [Gemmatimonadaceae bacterium]
MSGTALPERVQERIDQLARGDRSTALALAALVLAAGEDGSASFNEVAIRYRDDHLAALRAEGRDVEREAGRLSLDEVRRHLAQSVLPRLAGEGVVVLPEAGPLTPESPLRLANTLWAEWSQHRSRVAAEIRYTGEHPTPSSTPVKPPAKLSTLEAEGLVKMYRRRRVVNDVALRLQQGEIVGLLGPNGAGKTTTFYMIVGLIQPLAGRILLDGENITDMPMYRRARRGIGYLSQEPSIFRKLTVEDNILSILETLSLSQQERRQRLETLLDELSIKHLRHNKAFALSGGERRRLEITRALVTQPKFMMLDEPFAGVDPIAVHDIQTIVAGLRHRGIGVLISDHNVEQTLDIVDRAYIMFDGQVKVSGTVRELVFDETVAEIYLGPTLTARLRARFAADAEHVERR